MLDMELLGYFNADIQCNGRSANGRIFVAPYECNLFGIETIELLKLWTEAPSSYCFAVSSFNREDAIKSLRNEFSDLFSPTLGLCTKAIATLQLVPGARCVYRDKRPVPYAVMEKEEDELKRLESQGVISPVESSEWAAPIVVVKKANGKIRICGDYSTGLNAVVEPNLYPIPTMEELYGRLIKGRVFATIDLSDAYLMIGMCEESRKYLTISTHKGLYTFNRLAPGVRSAPGIFQRIVDQLVAGMDNVVAYFDDICVAGQDEASLLESVRQVLAKIRNYGFRVRAEKCNFFADEVKFLGNIIDKNGNRADPAKTLAVKNLPTPKDEKTLLSFLGAVNYYGKYIKGMSDLTAPMNHLLQKDVPWNWTKECEKSFNRFKSILQSDLVLCHYVPDMPIQVAADASALAIGAQINHEFPDGSIKAIAYASRTLTKAERAYSQIEREALGLVFAVKHFHRYIYGRKFTLITDHKPLLAIFGSTKGIAAHAANRIQRWQLIMRAYFFDIKYTSTTEFGYVDMLSRLIGDQPPDEDYVIACTQMEDLCKMDVNDAVSCFPVTNKEIVAATAKCSQFQRVMEYMQTGWPSSINQVQRDVHEFFRFKESLSVVNSCLLYRNRLVVPHVYRKRILKRLHDAHPGQERMLSLARSYVYWPGIDEEIREYVRMCQDCQSTAKTPTSSILYSWPQATRPWQRIHIDYAMKEGNNFLVIVDAYSKWPEIIQTTSTTSEKTIEMLQDQFNHWGNPEVLVSDNGTQFTSALFAQFLQKRGIKHLRSSPYFPQSQGQAERYVDTFKRALDKMKNEDDIRTNLGKFLFNYRATPVDSVSPAEKFIGRKIRSTLELLFKEEEEEGERDIAMEAAFNRRHGAKERTFLHEEEVYAKYHRRNGAEFVWVPAVILEKIGNVNYNVFATLPCGRQLIIRSHATQLRHRSASDTQTTPAVTGIPLDVIRCDNKPVPQQNEPKRSRYRPTRSSPPVLRPRIGSQ